MKQSELEPKGSSFSSWWDLIKGIVLRRVWNQVKKVSEKWARGKKRKWDERDESAEMSSDQCQKMQRVTIHLSPSLSPLVDFLPSYSFTSYQFPSSSLTWISFTYNSSFFFPLIPFLFYVHVSYFFLRFSIPFYEQIFSLFILPSHVHLFTSRQMNENGEKRRRNEEKCYSGENVRKF